MTTIPSVPKSLHQIPCPVLRTLANEGMIELSDAGTVDVSKLQGALQQLGLTETGAKLLARGAFDNAPVDPNDPNLANLFGLRGGPLDHSGDTGILDTTIKPFNPERLELLLSFASDEGLTLKNLAAARKKFSSEEHTGIRDHALGFGELTALLLVFGTRTKDGDLALSKEAVTSLFRDAKLPEGFEPRKVGLAKTLFNAVKMAVMTPFSSVGRAQAGLEQATSSSASSSSTGGRAAQGIGGGVCPFMSKQQGAAAVNEAQLAQAHSKPEER